MDHSGVVTWNSPSGVFSSKTFLHHDKILMTWRPSLQIEAWFWKPWLLRKRWFFFFSKMDEAWPNAPNLEMDAWSLEILIFFFFFWKWMRHGRMPLVYKLMLFCFLKRRWRWSFFFFWKWMRHGQMPLVQQSMWILKNLNA